MANGKKAYHPQTSFDTDIETLAKMIKIKGWVFSNVDGKLLEKQAVQQRDESTKFDELERQYLSAKSAFALAQQERYLHFARALNAALGAFRDDAAVLAELNTLKRSVRRLTKLQKEALAAVEAQKAAEAKPKAA